MIEHGSKGSGRGLFHYDQEEHIYFNEDDQLLEEGKDFIHEDAMEEECHLDDLKQKANLDNVKLEES